jgi:hypothetical protein
MSYNSLVLYTTGYTHVTHSGYIPTRSTYTAQKGYTITYPRWTGTKLQHNTHSISHVIIQPCSVYEPCVLYTYLCSTPFPGNTHIRYNKKQSTQSRQYYVTYAWMYAPVVYAYPFLVCTPLHRADMYNTTTYILLCVCDSIRGVLLQLPYGKVYMVSQQCVPFAGR